MLRQHEVITTTSGEDGKQILQQDDDFDVILCDLVMPNCSGFDLLNWLKVEKPSMCKRVVFMSGGIFTPKEKKQVDELEHPLLAKPMSKKELNQVIDKIMLQHPK